MMSYRRHNRYPILQTHICFFEYLVCQYCTIFRMTASVYHISDIMHKSRDFYHFNIRFAVTEFL